MNINKAKELLPVIQAISEGLKIQVKVNNIWQDVDANNNCVFLPEEYDYRIKPELKYRPFKDAEECWNEMQKHQPFGWVKCKEDGSLGLITLIISEENIFINGVGCNSERTMRGFTFADGTPFGILEED